jgi:integrase/recombinase XerD
MRYQYKREPLTQDEATRLATACDTHEEKFTVWTILDTGLRVLELASLSKDNIDWQGHRLMIYGKGGPYGKKTGWSSHPKRLVSIHLLWPVQGIRPLVQVRGVWTW